MKITDIKLYLVPERFLFLKVETDAGISGWGEPLLEGRAATMKATMEEIKELIIGSDPLKVEDMWQKLYRCTFYRGGPILMSAISGLDQALWDIRGKYFNVPVHKLLNGGIKEKIMVYRGIQGSTPEELAAHAVERVKAGYKLVKCSPNPATHYIDSADKIYKIIDMLKATREAVGPDIGIAIDFHGRIHKPMAQLFAEAIKPLGLAFIEEPVLPENGETIDLLRNYTATPIALGERLFNRWDFKEFLIKQRVDIVQPDLSHAGGISECMRIAAMAEAFDCAVGPHCPLSVIAFAACIQLDAAVANSVFQEQSIDIHNCTRENPSLQWIKNPEVFAYKDGFVSVPQGPGLGIEVDEELVAEAAKTPHNWKNPVWRTFDGAPIEW